MDYLTLKFKHEGYMSLFMECLFKKSPNENYRRFKTYYYFIL
jgi:hypothetical protein